MPKGLVRVPPEIRRIYRKAKVITRGPAAYILNISIEELRRREMDGVYPVAYDDKGRAWYEEEAIRRISGDVKRSRELHSSGQPLLVPQPESVSAPERPGRKAKALKEKKDKGPVTKRGYDAELGAKVFKHLLEGKSITEVIIEEKVHPEDALAIQDAFARVTGSIFLSPKDLSEMQHLPWRATWPPKNKEQMIFIIRSTMELQLQRCVKCQRAYARFCAGCHEEPVKDVKEENPKTNGTAKSVAEEEKSA